MNKKRRAMLERLKLAKSKNDEPVKKRSSRSSKKKKDDE